jgi:hypothetical protein
MKKFDKKQSDYIFLAFRYALSRHTMVAPTIKDYIIEDIEKIHSNWLRKMIDEIEEEAGYEERVNKTAKHKMPTCYINGWKGLINVLKKELDKRGEVHYVGNNGKKK